MFSSLKNRKPNYSDQELVSMIRTGRGTPPHTRAMIFLDRQKLPYPVLQAYRKFDRLEQRGGPSLSEVHYHTLLVMVQKIEKDEYNGQGTIDGFVYGIAYYHCLKHTQRLASGKHQPTLELNGYHENAHATNPENDREEFLQAILFVLEKELSEEEYNTCVAIFYEGMKYREYADQTGISVSGLKNRISRIRNKLNKIKNTIEKIVLPK